MAVLKLWEQGRLTIEDSLGKYFPNFPYQDITVKMLLSHSSGLPNYVHYLELNGWDKRKMVNNVDVLTSLVYDEAAAGISFGQAFQLLQYQLCTAGADHRKSVGPAYASFLNQTFFTPLEMKDTYVFTLKIPQGP